MHCTITRQQVRRPGYLEEFVAFWSAKDETEQIRMSLYTPQIGEVSEEMLEASDRRQVLADLMALGIKYRKLLVPKAVLDVYADPPRSPRDCVFAQTTLNVSADLETCITPCVFGGDPDCANCGCLASAGLAAIERHRILGVIPIASLFKASRAVGEQAKRWRHHNGASHGTPLSGRHPSVAQAFRLMPVGDSWPLDRTAGQVRGDAFRGHGSEPSLAAGGTVDAEGRRLAQGP